MIEIAGEMPCFWTTVSAPLNCAIRAQSTLPLNACVDKRVGRRLIAAVSLAWVFL